MDYEELRPFVFSVLKQRPQTQIIEIISAVEQRLAQKGIYKDQPQWSSGVGGWHSMPEEDVEKVREIINDLVVEGALMWGVSFQEPGPPWVKVTKSGEKVLADGEPAPHDPDGYLGYLKREVPSIDETILTYVSEALQAYLRGLILSSTVMLGCASEKAFLLLVDAYTKAVTDDSKRARFEKESYGPIKRKLDAFRAEVPNFRDKLPSNLRDDLEVQLDATFNLIRTTRNDAGHPSGRKVERHLVYANLRLFPPYCKRVYELIQFFDQNKV